MVLNKDIIQLIFEFAYYIKCDYCHKRSFYCNFKYDKKNICNKCLLTNLCFLYSSKKFQIFDIVK